MLIQATIIYSVTNHDIPTLQRNYSKGNNLRLSRLVTDQWGEGWVGWGGVGQEIEGEDQGLKIETIRRYFWQKVSTAIVRQVALRQKWRKSEPIVSDVVFIFEKLLFDWIGFDRGAVGRAVAPVARDPRCESRLCLLFYSRLLICKRQRKDENIEKEVCNYPF